MGNSVGFFGRQRSVHKILGGGIVADVMLWRRRDITVGILLGTLAAWVVFERSGYTLLSFASNVLLLLISVLFVWAKAAAILNRPPPPIPAMHLSEEAINEVAVFVHSLLDMALSTFHSIALGKDLNLFYRVAICLLLISIIGGLTDFLTLGYTNSWDGLIMYLSSMATLNIDHVVPALLMEVTHWKIGQSSFNDAMLARSIAMAKSMDKQGYLTSRSQGRKKVKC